MLHPITRSSLLISLFFVGLLLATSTAAHTQTFRGGINGTVTDPSGAVLPGAGVTAVETATNTEYKTVSSSAGEFALNDLPPGDYTVAAWQETLGTQEQKATVPPSGSVTANFTFHGE